MASPYQRDPERVRQQLQVHKDGGVTTRVPCKIQVPERYLDRHMASVGAEVYILGIFAIIMEDHYYGVSMANAMMRILPTTTDTVVVDGVNYLEFGFEAGDQIIYSVDLVQNDTLTYYIYDEHIAKGRIPWYLSYYDVGQLFDTAREHAGINLGSPAVMEMIISTIARNPEDMTQLYKHVLGKPQDVVSHPPTFIPFRSVIWNTSDTTSKLIGAYFSDSVTSALVNPSDKVERIEELLRT